jgi:hypothetical protein
MTVREIQPNRFARAVRWGGSLIIVAFVLGLSASQTTAQSTQRKTVLKGEVSTSEYREVGAVDAAIDAEEKRHSAALLKLKQDATDADTDFEIARRNCGRDDECKRRAALTYNERMKSINNAKTREDGEH